LEFVAVGDLQRLPRVPFPKRFVYVLKSRDTSPRYYTGLTSDVASRVAAHNAGRCPHTAGGHWDVDVVVEFADQDRAMAFEQYLKSGSGVAFAQRHLRRQDR
jgi:predicted GIY-YIG superfamily endonuclease